MNTSLSNIKAVAKRELIGYFFSPVAYVFLVIFLLLGGFFTFMVGRAPFFELGQASLASFFIWQPWLFLFLVPAVGMRLWSEERRLGTIELLLTMPITAWQAIVGKFLASWLFLALALFLTFPLILTVNYLGSPDNGVIFGSYVGCLLMAGGYLAVSCMTSAITRNQVVSFILSVVICLFVYGTACGRSEPNPPVPRATTGPAASASEPTTLKTRPRIVILGDSLTAGLGLPTDAAYPSWTLRKKWRLC